MSEVTPESIAQAITLKVLADAPDSRGPFVLEVHETLTEDHVQHIQRAWNAAFRQAGRPTPPLLVMGNDTVLRPATEEEVP